MLAIIIPAYKADFLTETLESLSGQTNKMFKVYVGDDASPYDIKNIVRSFEKKLDLTYKRFDTNLGGSDLVGQWKRCIEMSNEEWVWLFSDDDVASSDCVEAFYKMRQQKNNSLLFKFDTKIIGADGKVIRTFMDCTNIQKDRISASQFIYQRLYSDKFRSYMVEYIFNRILYDKLSIQNFPAAWAADDATWLNYAIENRGIDIIPSTVYWRYSGKNISSNNNNRVLVEQKTSAIIDFINYLHENRVKLDPIITNTLLAKWALKQLINLKLDNPGAFVLDNFNFLTKQEVDAAFNGLKFMMFKLKLRSKFKI